MRAVRESGARTLRWRGKRLLGIFNRWTDGRRRPGVLFLHGYPGAEKNVDVQRALLDRGVVSFAPRFAGAWGSEGLYRFSTLVDQARASLRWLARRPETDPGRLGVFGCSAGGWVALHLASRTPGLKACAAVSPVGALEDLPWAERIVRDFAGPLRVGSMEAVVRDALDTLRRHDAVAAVRRLRPPLLLIHGSADEVVPIAGTRRLFAAAGGPKRLVVEAGAGHDFLDRRARLARLAAGWLARRLKR